MKIPFFIFVLFLGTCVKAQALFKLTPVQKIILQPETHLFFTVPELINTSILYDRGFHKINTLHAKPPKLAFFCMMEDGFRKKFNVYLKLRAGNDESYRRLTSGAER